MISGREKFGAFIRREREAKELSFREMAKMIKVSPTYLSKVETEDWQPAEDKVRKIAKSSGATLMICWRGLVGFHRHLGHHQAKPASSSNDGAVADHQGTDGRGDGELVRQAQKIKEK